jgi:hypothetical protein
MVITIQLPNEERNVDFLTSSQFTRGTNVSETVLVFYFHSLFVWWLSGSESPTASIFAIPRFIVLDYLIYPYFSVT